MDILPHSRRTLGFGGSLCWRQWSSAHLPRNLPSAYSWHSTARSTFAVVQGEAPSKLSNPDLIIGNDWAFATATKLCYQRLINAAHQEIRNDIFYPVSDGLVKLTTGSFNFCQIKLYHQRIAPMKLCFPVWRAWPTQLVDQHWGN